MYMTFREVVFLPSSSRFTIAIDYSTVLNFCITDYCRKRTRNLLNKSLAVQSSHGHWSSPEERRRLHS